jgi:hypothetical protein
MPLQRGRHLDLDPRMARRQPRHDLRQITFQMNPKYKKIRDYHNSAEALLHEAPDRSRQIRLAEFQERSFYSNQ